MDHSTPSIVDLVALLDQPTLDALASRLHQVIDGTENPSQLLFSFIDAGIENLEFEKKYETASEVLIELEEAR